MSGHNDARGGILGDGLSGWLVMSLEGLKEGDEVVVCAPYWVSYLEIVKVAEGIPVVIKAGIDSYFKISGKQLEAAISNAKIVDTSTIDTSKVTILTKVTITNQATKKTMTYQLVGEKEADLKAGKISASSPIGKGLIGKKVGELAEIQAPNGVMKFVVDNITI